jgi:CBS-domain-containing membrane protein
VVERPDEATQGQSSSAEMESLKPADPDTRRLRQRLDLKGELILALLPTVTVLAVLGMVELVTQQRLLFASLASSAFLIYLDPQHGTNSVRTLVLSQMVAALTGWGTFVILGDGYISGGTAMVLTILIMIIADVVHPPAVSTAMAFALRSGDASNVALFGLAVVITATLVVMERIALWLIGRYERKLREAARGRSGR